MTEQLFIRLLADNQVQYLHVAADGEKTAVQEGTLNDVPTVDKRCRIVVLLSSFVVTLHQLHLPNKSRRQLLQAIPFALENDLLDEPDQYFFALAKQRSKHHMNVAVVRRDEIKRCLAVLKAVNIVPDVLLPDALALDYHPGKSTVYIEDDRAWVRTGEYAGFSADADNLDVLLQDQECIDVDQPLLQQAAMNLSHCPMNLLQGEFRQRKSSLNTPWYASPKTAIILCIVMLVLLLLVKVTQTISLRHVEHAQQQQLLSLYQQSFPHGTLPSDPKAVMTQHLMHLRQASEGDPVLQNIALLGSVLSAYPNLSLQSLQFEGETLIVTLPLVNLQWQEKLITALKACGLQVSSAYEKGLLTLKLTAVLSPLRPVRHSFSDGGRQGSRE